MLNVEGTTGRESVTLSTPESQSFPVKTLLGTTSRPPEKLRVHRSEIGACAYDQTVRASVSVVICAYTFERQKDLFEAIRSVEAQMDAPDEVVVVIDYNDPLLQVVTDAFPGAVVVPNRETKGLSGARNTGVAVATRQVVAFLDDDAAAAPDWLETLTRHYADPAVAGVGGAAIPSWPSVRPDWFPREFDWVVGCSYTGQPTEVAEVRNFIGANMSFRREVFTKAGVFNSAVGRVGKRPVGCEETELCIRVTHVIPGARLLLDPAATVSHKVAEERVNRAYYFRRCYAEGLSKAMVARLTDSGRALSSEKTYVSRTLPAGVVRGLGQALRGDSAGAARSVMIVAGLFVTGLGYIRGRLSRSAVA